MCCYLSLFFRLIENLFRILDCSANGSTSSSASLQISRYSTLRMFTIILLARTYRFLYENAEHLLPEEMNAFESLIRFHIHVLVESLEKMSTSFEKVEWQQVISGYDLLSGLQLLTRLEEDIPHPSNQVLRCRDNLLFSNCLVITNLVFVHRRL